MKDFNIEEYLKIALMQKERKMLSERIKRGIRESKIRKAKEIMDK